MAVQDLYNHGTRREMQMWLGTLLIVLMGVFLGLLGGGGSILAVPILVYVIGLAIVLGNLPHP